MGSPLPDLIALHAADRLLGLDPIDWLAEALDQRKKDDDAEKAKKKKWPGGVRHSPGPPAGRVRGRLRAPRLWPLKIELRDGRLVSVYNGIEFTLEHWHFEVFNAPKADNDVTLEDLNWKLQFQTNLKGYVDAVAVPLEPNVKPIVFTRRADKQFQDLD